MPQVRTYATRVREMLEEMAGRANGKLKLEVIDPLPFSEDEDRATAFGLTRRADRQRRRQDLPRPRRHQFDERQIGDSVPQSAEGIVPRIRRRQAHPRTVASEEAGRRPAQRACRSRRASIRRRARCASAWAVEQQLDAIVRRAPAQRRGGEDDRQGHRRTHRRASEELQRRRCNTPSTSSCMRGGHLLVFVDPNAEADDGRRRSEQSAGAK